MTADRLRLDVEEKLDEDRKWGLWGVMLLCVNDDRAEAATELTEEESEGGSRGDS